MIGFQFNISYPIDCRLTGKFEAPSETWIHEDFELVDFELFVVTSGSLFISYRNVKYQVNEGEYLILPPSTPPNNRRKGYKPSDCCFYWMHFTPVTYNITDTTFDAVGFTSSENYNLLIGEYNNLVHPDKVIILMKQLQDSVRSRYNKISVNYMATNILCEIYNQMHIRNANPHKNDYKKKQMFNDIVDYIKDHAYTNLRVFDISRHFGYNEKYLSQLFSSVSGITLKQYILNTKIELANYLLSDTNKPISEISYLLGFTDNHNFMKLYKRVTGMTPSQYRNAYSQRLLYHV